MAKATEMKLDMEWDILHDGTTCQRLVEWCVPHDMGNPGKSFIFIIDTCISQLL